MLVKNKKIQLNEAKEDTIILSKTNKNFIILDDNTYCNKEDIDKIRKLKNHILFLQNVVFLKSN